MWEGREKQEMGEAVAFFDGVVAWKRESSAVYLHRSTALPLCGTLPHPGHKAKPYQKFATVTASPTSCSSLPSHISFLNLIKGTYNMDRSLCIYRKIFFFNSICCL